MLYIFCLSKHTYRIYNPISPLDYFADNKIIAILITEIINSTIKTQS